VPTGPTFRRLRPDDAEACARLHAQAFSSPWPAHDVQHQIESADRVASGASDAALALAGFVMTRVVKGEADLLTFVVDRKLRRKGIASGLMGFHLSTLVGMGVGAVFLEVEAENLAARRLYEKFGFASVGTRSGYYRQQRTTAADALVMRCDL
jgi:ribosomal-protein-alanine N-acetyltransferase